MFPSLPQAKSTGTALLRALVHVRGELVAPIPTTELASNGHLWTQGCRGTRPLHPSLRAVRTRGRGPTGRPTSGIDILIGNLRQLHDSRISRSIRLASLAVNRGVKSNRPGTPSIGGQIARDLGARGFLGNCHAPRVTASSFRTGSSPTAAFGSSCCVLRGRACGALR